MPRIELVQFRRLLSRTRRELLPSVLPRRHAIWRGSRRKPAIALTFDDGPDPDHTPPLLDALDELGIKGTFFVVGQRVHRYPRIVAELVERGHEVGNHSYTHNDYQVGPLRDVAGELSRTNREIELCTGRRPRLFRPPFGALNAEIVWTTLRQKMTLAMWSFDSLDHTGAPPEHAHLNRVRQGDVVLFHDDGGLAIDLIRAHLPWLLERGLRCRTVSQLIDHTSAPDGGVGLDDGA